MIIKRPILLLMAISLKPESGKFVSIKIKITLFSAFDGSKKKLINLFLLKLLHEE